MLQELPEHVERLMKLAGHSKLGPWLLVSTSEHSPPAMEQQFHRDFIAHACVSYAAGYP
jgi:hypothetical protein